MARQDILAKKLQLLTELAQRTSSDIFTSAIPRLKELLDEHNAAIINHSQADAEAIARSFDDLARLALIYHYGDRDGQTRTQRLWMFVGIGVLVAVFLGVGIFLTKYVGGVGMTRLEAIESTRPILVITAIISTIAFGGALLLGSLFSSESTFEERFRHAREIFLVFSGVFGTVIGFYFGAGDGNSSKLAIDATVQDATLVAYAAGGVAPYRFTINYGADARSKSALSKDGWAKISFDKAKDVPIPLSVTVVDAKDRKGEIAVTLNREDLAKDGWTLPAPANAGGK